MAEDSGVAKEKPVVAASENTATKDRPSQNGDPAFEGAEGTIETDVAVPQAEEGDAPVEQDIMASFDKGYEYFAKDDFRDAAPLFYKYITDNTSAAEDYDWAEFFLGVSLKKIGFSHASVDTLSFLVTRKPNTQIVTYILELFEEISRTMPYDRGKVILKSVCDQEYGFVDSKLTDFINYHQGVFDWENGFDEWGDHHFNKIKKGSYYDYSFRYQKALYDISRDEIDPAIIILNEINEASFDGEDLKNDVRKTLARLMYEKKDYQRADDLYNSISNNIVFQAQNLLERSWAQYRLKHQEKAMGLLYAFKAPVYRNYFTPEYFLLKSFIYKDVCHYARALGVIDEFRDHYREALDDVYGRADLTENKVLLLALLGHRKINDLWRFLRLLDTEQARIENIKDPLLKGYLEKLYALQIEETRREFKLLVEDKYEALANDLLEYEEKADLMAYEIGLDMYQRVYQYHYNEETDKKETVKRVGKHYQAFYPFQGEFWNDELNTYKVILEDKCACMEEWDIFFK
ncbi:MAG: hypothetical protein KKD44_07105 [Proteobacteria bacterium]|nr:hypothetical protein [Pseudomonadota bacterium]